MPTQYQHDADREDYWGEYPDTSFTWEIPPDHAENNNNNWGWPGEHCAWTESPSASSTANCHRPWAFVPDPRQHLSATDPVVVAHDAVEDRSRLPGPRRHHPTPPPRRKQRRQQKQKQASPAAAAVAVTPSPAPSAPHGHPAGTVPDAISSPDMLSDDQKLAFEGLVAALLEQRPRASPPTEKERSQFYAAIFGGKWHTGRNIPEPETVQKFLSRSARTWERCPVRVGTLDQVHLCSGSEMMGVELDQLTRVRSLETSVPLTDSKGNLIIYARVELDPEQADINPMELIDALQRPMNQYHRHINWNIVGPRPLHIAGTSYVFFAIHDALTLRELSRFNLQVAVYYARKHLKARQRRRQKDAGRSRGSRSRSMSGGENVDDESRTLQELPGKIQKGKLLPIRLKVDDFGFVAPKALLDFYRPILEM